MISVKVDSEKALEFIFKVKARIESEGGQQVVEKVAFWTLQQLQLATPKKWDISKVRQSWKIYREGQGWEVSNSNKVMLFLEQGTKSHGPKTAGALFIPLTKRAALRGGGLLLGRDFLLVRKVKGVKARNIVAKQKVATEKRLYDDMRHFIRGAIEE